MGGAEVFASMISAFARILPNDDLFRRAILEVADELAEYIARLAA